VSLAIERRDALGRHTAITIGADIRRWIAFDLGDSETGAAFGTEPSRITQLAERERDWLRNL